MAVLVTGGAGYIGSHTVKLLLQCDYAPVVYDNLVYGHREALLQGDFVHGDLHDTARLVHVLRQYDITDVIHFAAFAYVGESVQDPLKYYANNVAGTLSLLQAMRIVGVQHLIFSSTCAVYGVPQHPVLTEAHPLCPVNPYGESKLFVERMLQASAAAYGLRWISLRYFNAAGADPEGELGESHDPETHLTYTSDPLHAFRFRERVSAGMVSVNNSTSGAEAHLPFGGNGKSGNGSRQSGIWVLDQFTRWQSMNWDYSGRLQKAQMDVAELTADLDYRLPAADRR